MLGKGDTFFFFVSEVSNPYGCNYFITLDKGVQFRERWMRLVKEIGEHHLLFWN